jgi:hypothetical protein
MLCSEIIAVCSEIHTKHVNTLCGQNVELLNVKSSGTVPAATNKLQNCVAMDYGLNPSSEE